MTEALAYWGESEGGALPLDLYGQPLRYVPPRTIRTVGANGVDNGGASDDWDSGRRPNDGHWLREDDPAARRRLALCIRTAAIVVLFAFGVMRSKRAAIMVSLVVCGAIFAWMMPVGFDRGAFRATTASISPEWIHVIGASGYLMIAAGIVFFLRELATIERKPM